MPTPESAAFLAKKPTVAPTFDGVDYDDNKKLKQAQDAIIREQWVQVMMGRLIREELSKCYYREGVNHLEKCGHLRGQSCLCQICLTDPIHTPQKRTKTSETGIARVKQTHGAMTDIFAQSDTSRCLTRPRSGATYSSSKIISGRSNEALHCRKRRANNPPRDLLLGWAYSS